jgi:AMP-binding enzyme/Condensation domain/Phosphopantetheine attachment site/AMP-binding enzyme C-terminal domain
LFSATDDWYKFNEHDCWTLFHAYIFDVSVWEMWGALLYGGKLVVPSATQVKDFHLFYGLCTKEQVTVLNQTPTAFYQFRDITVVRTGRDKLDGLRYVILAGEALNFSQLRPWFDHYAGTRPKLVNMYGPTETLHVTCTEAIKESDILKSSLIGRVIPDSKAYVLDSNLTPTPIGAIGELHIGGMGLARGYLNKPELTAERFIANPFQTEADRADTRYGSQGRNARLYKTGDLVRWLADGSLEYVGRNDFQVKLRGYRIELSEIESILLDYEGIKQSVVLAKEHHVDDAAAGSSSNQYLVGYYVSETALDGEAILSHLRSKLPEYMVPSALMYLEKLPLTVNGKLDRRALPDPVLTNADNYVAPRSELEGRMCQIWGEVLGFPEEQIGIQDDFFRLGGNSILATKLASKLSKELDRNISVSAIFTQRTVYQLSHYLSYNTEAQVTISKSVVSHPEEQLLSFAQERLWFIEQYEQGTHAYNIPLVVKLSADVDLAVLERSIKSVVHRHEVLRTLIKEDEEGNGYQLVLDDPDHPLVSTSSACQAGSASCV